MFTMFYFFIATWKTEKPVKPFTRDVAPVWSQQSFCERNAVLPSSWGINPEKKIRQENYASLIRNDPLEIDAIKEIVLWILYSTILPYPCPGGKRGDPIQIVLSVTYFSTLLFHSGFKDIRSILQLQRARYWRIEKFRYVRL